MGSPKCRRCSGRLSVHYRSMMSLCIYCPTCHRIAVVSEGPARTSQAEMLKVWWDHVGLSRERR